MVEFSQGYTKKKLIFVLFLVFFCLCTHVYNLYIDTYCANASIYHSDHVDRPGVSGTELAPPAASFAVNFAS